MDSPIAANDYNKKFQEPKKASEFYRTCGRPESPRFKDVRRYEEFVKENTKAANSKEHVFNNAFYEEGVKEDIPMHKLRIPIGRTEGTWTERVLEKERKMRREETKMTHERLRMIEKRTKYIDKGMLSPATKAKNMHEPVIGPRSSSKKEIIMIEDRGIQLSSEHSDNTEKLAPKRLLPRSVSRKELTPFVNRNSARSPLHRQTISPLNVNYN